jgi:hypothetical protein
MMMIPSGSEQGGNRSPGAGAGRAIGQDHRAFALIVGGLLVQLGSSFFWSPGAFVLAAGVGVPLVLLGTVMLGRAMRRKGREGGA